MTTPTQGEHAQPEALRLAESITRMDTFTDFQRQELDKAAAKLRSLHAQVAAQPAAPQGGAYAELPDTDLGSVTGQELDKGWYSAQQMRDFADRTHAKRASHGQAPAGADLAFMLKTARLLAELHGETALSEQQCAKHMGIDLVSWRKLEDCFSGGVFMPEGGGAELPREDSESVLREALGMRPSPTPQADSQPAPTGRIAELEDALSSCLQLVNQLNEHHIPDGCSRLIRHIKDAAATVSNAQARAPADSGAAPAAQEISPWNRALEIRIAQGWKLTGDRIPVLYTDSINGEQVCRDDLWLCTTAALAAPTPAAQADSVLEDAAREAIDKVLALFPFNAPIQTFTIGGGPCLTADGDTEFYSAKRIWALLRELKTTLAAARKQGANHDNA